MYRIMIPINLIDTLGAWFPKWKILEIQGHAAIQSTKRENVDIPFEYGAVSPTLINRIEIHRRYEGIDDAEELGQIVTKLRTKYRVIGGTINLLKRHVDLSGFDVDYATLVFEKYTPHKNLDLARVVDGGAFPEQQLYQYLSSVKEELPMNVKWAYKSTVLALTQTEPKRMIDNDTFVMAMRENKMVGYRLAQQEWNIKHVDFRKAGRDLKVGATQTGGSYYGR